MMPKFNRLLSGMLSASMLLSFVPNISAHAEESNESYPYTLFAAANIEGAISSTASNFCVNGNVTTNGTIVSEANLNINGVKEENADEEMIYIFNKIDNQYFSDSNVNEYNQDYILEDTNINVNLPTEVLGEATLTGNININTAFKALEDVNLCGDVQNANNSIIFSKYGDVVIDGQNVNLNNLIYAPFGSVCITAQNLNLNNVIIIAESIVLNSPNVNANYGSNIASFIGNESEPFNVPYEEWSYLKDRDEDGLPDLIEKEIGCDPLNTDTDGDLLPDGYEVLTLGTDPVKPDTDDNSISDYDEDFDLDDLTNGQEYELGTDPYDDDTDGDTLSDGDEVIIYLTDPLIIDTDQDGLDDGDEIYFNTDPNIPDSDGNGVLDGKEKRDQTFIHEVDNEDCAVTEVRIDLKGTGNLQKITSAKSIMNKDMMCTDVVGLVGEPFSVRTSSEFDTATLTFTIDQSKLEDTEFDDLMFLWHDEENHNFVELETIHDQVNSTVSIETTHFSKYMVVDKTSWYKAWSVRFNYNPAAELPSAPTVKYNTVLTIDCSGSMSINDPIQTLTVNSPSDALHPHTCERIKACDGFIDNMNYSDKAAVVLFTDSASIAQNMTNDRTLLKSAVQRISSSGGTDFNSAISESVDSFDASDINAIYTTNRIILLSDGESSVSDATLDLAKNKKIKIYTIGLGSSSYDYILEDISEYTGGEFYKAYTASDLVDIYKEIGINGDFDTTDTDGDKLYDAVESAGIRLENGTIIYTDPSTKHSDTDTLEDGEEINPEIKCKPMYYLPSDVPQEYIPKTYFFVMNSNPLKKDTDNDGINDGEDDDPLTPVHNELIDAADKDELRARLKAQRDKDIAFVTNAKNLYSANKCVNIIFDNDQTITDVANKYKMPKSYIQSVMFRELYCYGLDDPLADFAFENYYISEQNVEWYLQQSDAYKAIVGYPTPLFPQRENTSTGLGQIQLTTGISANNWGYGKGYKNTYLQDTWKTRRDMYLDLQESDFNIDMVALVLMWGLTTGDECAVSDPGENYWSFSENTIKALFSRYNSNGGVINEYGKAAFNLYVIFEDYQ